MLNSPEAKQLSALLVAINIDTLNLAFLSDTQRIMYVVLAEIEKELHLNPASAVRRYRRDCLVISLFKSHQHYILLVNRLHAARLLAKNQLFDLYLKTPTGQFNRWFAANDFGTL